jgi:hypothetical protein
MASVAEVDDVAGGARYIDNYLNTQSNNVRSYIVSTGWVLPGWVCWSLRFKNNYGVYPEEKHPGIPAKLARMSKRARDEIIMPKLMNRHN